MGKNNKNFIQNGDRAERQANEGYAEVQTDLPKGRFQESKQVLTPDQLGGMESPVTGTASGDTKGTAARAIKSSISLRPAADVEVLDGKQVGGVPLEVSAVTRSAAGVGNVSLSDDVSKIPYQKGGYRPDTRYGKKRSEELFELDNTVSEQVVFSVDDALDLREAPDAKQGYNGRKQFKQVRSKKNSMGRPQSLLFEASADLDIHNYVVSTSGQMVNPESNSRGGYPNITYGEFVTNREVDGVKYPIRNSGYYTMNGDEYDEEEATVDYPSMSKANYLLEKFSFDIINNRIANPKFHETQYDIETNALTRDQANHNWQVDENNIAKSVIRMQTELGRETTEKWSPLGYVIEQPYEYNMLMHDIEASTGAIAAAAYRSAVSCLSYQRNIISKDGIGPVASAIRMFAEGSIGSLANANMITDTTGIANGVWNKGMYARGSAAAIVNMFDSPNKYRTKADFLGMQRSLPLHLSQADNNINPFHCKPQFLKVLDKAHLFSTEDGSYNPALPIHATRKVYLQNPLSLNYFLDGWMHPGNSSAEGFNVYGRDRETGTFSRYRYQYSDIRNSYDWRVQHPIVEGLMAWMLRHEAALVRTYGNGAHVEIPASFDMMSPSMFQFMICSASQLIAMKRNIIFRDILFAGEQSTYIWDDLVSLKDADPLHSSQLTIQGYSQDLKLGKMAIDTALRTYWGTYYTALTNDTTATNEATFALPWTFNEQSIRKSANGSPITYTVDSGFNDASHPFNMSIPSIRSGVRHAYSDLIKSVSESDVRLSLDRFLEPLSHVGHEDDDSGDNPFNVRFVTRDDAHADDDEVAFSALRYDLNSDGRVLQTMVNSSAPLQHGVVLEDSLFIIPKEVGFIWDAPSGLVPVVSTIEFRTNNDGEVAVGYASGYYTENDDVLEFAKWHRFFNYQCNVPLISSVMAEKRSYRVKDDADRGGSINRSAALSQTYWTAYSNGVYRALNDAYTANIGIALSTSYADVGAEVIPDCMYRIQDSIGAGQATTHLKGITSYARMMWSLIQRGFYPVNPFEQAYDDITNNTNPADPFEVAYYFGLCGFLASDYTQAVLERLDTFDQLGLDYTEDVNTKESLLFR